MKITIEKETSNKAVFTLELDGKRYYENWEKEEDGRYSTSDSIIGQLENEGVELEVELGEFLESIQVDDFLDLCELY